MKDGTILILAGMFLVAVLFISGGIAGNPITGSAVKVAPAMQTAINNGVLTMLNQCETFTSGDHTTNCNIICKEKGKICITGYSFANEALLTFPILCSQVPTIIFGQQLTFTGEVDIGCVCCKP